MIANEVLLRKVMMLQLKTKEMTKPPKKPKKTLKTAVKL